MARLEKDESGIDLINKGEFVNLSEELTDDAVSIEDIDEVLQTLERATSVETETEEPLIEETSSSAESEEGMGEEVELDLSAAKWIRLQTRFACTCGRWVLFRFSRANRKYRLRSGLNAVRNAPRRRLLVRQLQ